jgi:hypothetical protein
VSTTRTRKTTYPRRRRAELSADRRHRRSPGHHRGPLDRPPGRLDRDEQERALHALRLQAGSAAGHRRRGRGGVVKCLEQVCERYLSPQPSPTKQLPAGRIFVPQVRHSGASTEEPVITSSHSADVCPSTGAGFAVPPRPDRPKCHRRQVRHRASPSATPLTRQQYPLDPQPRNDPVSNRRSRSSAE